MQMFKLTQSYTPGDTIKKFDSLVWAERYQEPGDFKLVVEDDVSILTALPIGTLISHTDTLEVMIVETHELVRNADKGLTTTISGRSLESFTENRVTTGSKYAMYNGAGAALTEVTAVLAPETIARDLLRAALMPAYANVTEEIPLLSVYTSVASPDPARAYVIPRGDVYSAVAEFLKVANAGIRNKRPNGAQTTLDMVVHDGNDLTTSVVFYAQRGDLDDTTYLWSNKGYKNYAQVATHTDTRLHKQVNLPAVVSALRYRVLYVEADDLEGSYTPAVATDVVAGRAQAALDERTSVNIMSSRITESAKPKFKIDYDIGDRVTVFGEFSVSQVMHVTEHILTVDKKGIRGFPSLTAA